MIRLNDNKYLVDELGNKTEKFVAGKTSLVVNNRQIPAEDLSVNYGGYIVAKVDGNNETLDYPYYNRLIKAGYIVFRDYDKERIHVSEGYSIRAKVVHTVLDAIRKLCKEYQNATVYNNSFIVDSEEGTYTIYIDTVDNMVTKNMSRRDNNLKYFPYDKDVDRFGCVYLAIFEEPSKLERDDRSFGTNFVKRLIGMLPEYHFNNLPVKSRIIYTED